MTQDMTQDLGGAAFSVRTTATGSTKVERSGADLIGTVAVDRTEDVLMLFRYTENPPENTISTPAALRVSAVASAYTEISSFPYTGVKGNLRHFAGFTLACLARIAWARASNFSASSPRPVLRSRAA